MKEIKDFVRELYPPLFLLFFLFLEKKTRGEVDEEEVFFYIFSYMSLLSYNLFFYVYRSSLANFFLYLNK